MNLALSETQRLYQTTARQFSDAELAPQSARWDEEKALSRDVFRAFAELGFGGIYIDEAHGGTGLSRLDSVLVFEQLARGDVSHTAMLTIHNMASWMIARYGSDELRARFLPKLLTCEHIASYCLTEPGSGSDAAALATKAVEDGDHYVLNGSKAFISGGGWSDIYVVMVRTSDDGARGVSTLVVEDGTPGLSFGANERKMGWNAQPTRQVNFDNCRVPKANLIGHAGDGFRYAMSGLDGGRVNIAACSLGGAQKAMDAALAYTRERKQFGSQISAFQSTQFKLADMQTKLTASRLMVYDAAGKLDRGDPDAGAACAMAKRYATDSCWEVANDALQLHGGYGYLKDYGVEQIVRDLRVHQILEGTNEIMRMIVGRSLLRQ